MSLFAMGRFKMGLWGGLAHAALDTYLLRGNAPWTLQHRYVYLIACSYACTCTMVQPAVGNFSV